MKKLLIYNVACLTIFFSYMVCSCFATTNPKLPFIDVTNDDWYYSDLNSLYKKGIIDGYEDNTFRGENIVTAEEFLKLLIISTNSIDTTNVNAMYWFEPYFNKCVELGIIQKNANMKSFNYKLSREEAAAWLHKFIQNSYVSIDISKAMYFNDEKDISSYFKDDVKALSSLNILNGTPDGNFLPKDFVSRSTSVKMLNAILKVLGDTNDSLKYKIIENDTSNSLLENKGYFLKTTTSSNLLYICMGEKNTGGYSLSVENVIIHENDIEVVVNETVPAMHDIVTMAFTYPHIVIDLSKTPSNIMIKSSKGEIYNNITSIINDSIR